MARPAFRIDALAGSHHLRTSADLARLPYLVCGGGGDRAVASGRCTLARTFRHVGCGCRSCSEQERTLAALEPVELSPGPSCGGGRPLYAATAAAGDSQSACSGSRCDVEASPRPPLVPNSIY